MKMSRRNVLAGLGGLAVGGGALLGSGAFSSVEATRDVEVNVTADIADAENIADVLLDVGRYDEIAVADSPNGTIQDETNLAPETTLGLSTRNADTGSGYTDRYVSLVANDVTIVFGYEDSSTDDFRLPVNSTVNFDKLLTLVQGDTGTASDPTDIAFGDDLDSGGLGSATVEIDDNTVTFGGSSGYPENISVAPDSDEQDDGNGSPNGNQTAFGVTVTTGTSDEDNTGEFGIAVGDNISVDGDVL
jgi:hypothetical protein